MSDHGQTSEGQVDVEFTKMGRVFSLSLLTITLDRMTADTANKVYFPLLDIAFFGLPNLKLAEMCFSPYTGRDGIS